MAEPTKPVYLLDFMPDDWRAAVSPYVDPDVVAALSAFVVEQYNSGPVYPRKQDIYAAYKLCPLAATRVLILGQDPYIKPGQAHGLSFSVPPGVPVPPSLRNVYQEMRDDLGVEPPPSGDLTAWCRQGVMLLNAVLTVRAGTPNSHKGHGWENVTDATIRALNDRAEPVVFVLWGAAAKAKAPLITNPRHVVLRAGHPSPMNTSGFLGSRPFSRINAALVAAGNPPVRWSPAMPRL
ncbi:uracil-DNA glycosylase [Dactylosporangium matsuzakiense]|uniref:Uracil-DNA glycosylase n=1 Tax=Dactylosporangium matsuzakiense TaxID=53360 RepID=A0A9W6KGR8_9ACTN|nr:uracil-DNA glycosylase [Dactylosporangium matsuzakiense]UWZ46642.1 uracil-DNA glycosylase [Dactylosporangium matsuzakiense]GLL01223.1 uracil-DNA glycosylase 2 [Dactylosporangium matsuzakiense]